jgi:ABC-type transporter Mla subunit MlaD
MESRDNTLKVGLVVVAAIVLAVVGYMVLQDVFILRDYVKYSATFDNSRGAQPGTVVELDGEAIGKVIGSRLMAGGRGAEVDFRIKRDVPLYPEYEFVISQDDLFGEKYINVVDPVTDRRPNTSQPVPAEHVFTGRNRSGIGNMLAGAITETLTQASDAMGTDEIRSNIGEIADKMVTTLDNVNQLVVSVNEIVGGSGGYVEGSLANVYAMSENFRKMSEDLEAQPAPTWPACPNP